MTDPRPTRSERADIEQRSASPADRDAAARQASRLRWELSRTRSRRTVRAALLASEVVSARAGGAADVVATLRGQRVRPDLDVIAPAEVRRTTPYPHLEVAHLAEVPPFAGAAANRRVDPADLAALRRQAPDLVVLDDLRALARWDGGARRELAAALGHAGAVVTVVRDDAEQQEATRWPATTTLRAPGVEVPVPGRGSGADAGAGSTVLPWWPCVDERRDNPVGWRREAAGPPVVVAVGSGPLRAAAVALATDLGVAALDLDDPQLGGACAVIVADPRTLPGASAVVRLAARGLPVVVPAHVPPPPELAGLVDVAAHDALHDAAGVYADLDVRERASVARRRLALTAHGGRARLEQVLDELGVPRVPPARISVLLATRRPELLDAAVAQIVTQSHPELEIVAALHGDGFADDAEARVVTAAAAAEVRAEAVRVPASAPLGDVLNAALDRATGTLVAKMDDDDLYGRGHLADLQVALAYSGADVVGRWANETHLTGADVQLAQDLDRQERWAHHLPGATMLVHGDVLRAVRFRRVPRHVDTHLLRSVHAAGGSAYATHRFGFIRRRHDDHTYDADDAKFAAAPDARHGLDRSVLEV